MPKMILMGLVLVLSTACLPHMSLLPEKTWPESSGPGGDSPSLFTPIEMETLLSCPSPAEKQEEPLPFSMGSIAGMPPERLELPISDESNENFNFEVLPGDVPKREPDFDIPIVLNDKVEHFIQYFQTTAKSRFGNWLARSEKYIPFMRTVLREKGLPEDLVYLALIESGFNPYAYSRSKASGPWQFIYLTGKRYGLKVNAWVDERRDPEKSTLAAAKYLKDLYDMFECWYLAAAGYNAGEYKIMTAMKRYRTEDFWELTQYRYLKQETKDYVPQMIAAALIAKDPEAYGFTDIEYQEPLRYDKVAVPPLTDLHLIAKIAETTVEEIKDLNPELRKGCTPPDADYEIRIPFGKGDTFSRNFEALPSREKMRFKTHIVKKGETVQKIARVYRTDLEALLEMNQLKKGTRLSPGMDLVIPLPRIPDKKMALPAQKKSNGEALASRPRQEIFYTIKKGDSLWSISTEMGINIGAISRWNNLHPEKKLMPGDKIRIKLGESEEAPAEPVRGKKEMIYVVKPGDSLWSIAKRYHLSIAEIRAWNQLETDQIHPSKRLKLRVGTARSPS